MDGLSFRVIRKSISYSYKFDMSKPDSWDNNKANNMLDDFILYADEAEIFRVKVQTVANIPGGRFNDTIAPGKMKMKLFIGEGPKGDKRNFYGRIHGLCDCYDLDGQYIDTNSVERLKGKNGAPEDFTRWLMHDTQKHRPNPPMVLTSVAWSAGCFITTPSNLAAYGEILDAYKCDLYSLISGELIEEE